MADGVAITPGTGVTAATKDASTLGSFINVASQVQVVEVGVVASNVASSRPQTGTVTSVADTASSTTLLSASQTRKGFRVFNHSPYRLYVKYAATASIAAGGWNVYIEPYGYLVEEGFGGRVDGIWSANGSGYAQIVELV